MLPFCLVSGREEDQEERHVGVGIGRTRLEASLKPVGSVAEAA